jgi:hypothetical protein
VGANLDFPVIGFDNANYTDTYKGVASYWHHDGDTGDTGGKRRSGATMNRPTWADEETVFTMLADERRRVVLRELSNQSDGVELERLAEVVAEANHGPDYEESHTRSTSMSLYHTHLPKLVDAMAIRWEEGEYMGTAETDIYIDILDYSDERLDRFVN